MEQSSTGVDKQFKWGKRRVTGAGRKDVQYYESFTYGGGSEYSLYDCVLIGDANNSDSTQLYVGKIINLWEHNDPSLKLRKVEILWFFKHSEIPSSGERVLDALANEIFLASGTGPGLTNENHLEAICGKCNVVCISKDIRNPQPSDEEIKLADYLFYRTFDVGSRQISEKIVDQIAGVDVEFIFNRTSCEKNISPVQKVADSSKPNRPTTSGSVRQNEYPEERSNKDPGRRDGGLDYCIASGSMRDDCQRKYQDNEVEKRLTKQKSGLAEERCSTLDVSPQKKRKLDGSIAVSDVRERSRLGEERCRKNLYCSDDMLQKKRELDGSLAVSHGRIKQSQKTRHDGRKDIEPIRAYRGEVYPQKPSDTNKKQDQWIPRFSEGKERKHATEKDVFKKPISDSKSRLTEGKILPDTDYRRHYRVFEVTQKPDPPQESKWYRDLPWEENLRCAEEERKLVLLQNLDPTHTSKEVENIVYSALTEHCTARMIERTSTTIPHIGEALVIFKTSDAAKRVIRRLHEGCLLLSNGRVLVATSAKVNSPEPPLRFTGHIKPRAQWRQKTTNAVATSHSSQTNTIEFEMALDWRLYQDRYELSWKRLFERQSEEMKKLKINFKPKQKLA